MKRLVIDIDGVACAHAEAICEQVNLDFGLNSKADEVTTWDHNFGPITFVSAVAKYYPLADFIGKMKCTRGIQSFVNRVRLDVEVIFGSARKLSHDATKGWVAEHFGAEYQVLFVKSKSELNPDFVIDDLPAELIAVAKNGGTGFLFRQPWNDSPQVREQVGPHPGIHIVERFEQIIVYLAAT